jgi:hypothetical protein
MMTTSKRKPRVRASRICRIYRPLAALIVVGASIVCVTATGARAARESKRRYQWPQVARTGRTLPGEIVREEKQVFLRIRKEADTPKTLTLLVIDSPPITAARYALVGDVRYEGVNEKAHLEMWSVFPGGAKFFTKALASEGPLEAIEGSSDWRRFALPFDTRSRDRTPERLELRLVLPDKGRVDITSPVLIQDTAAAAKPGGQQPLAMQPAVAARREKPAAPEENAWWGPRFGGIGGGIAGALIGLLFALCGYLSSRGRARGLVMSLLTALVASGVGLLTLGTAAVAFSQPYAVTYPPLLTGTIAIALGTLLFRRARRLYTDAELRKMRSMDA